jgi:hypothetical protein
MVNELLLLIGMGSADYTASVAVQASYTLHTQPLAPVKDECCGRCKNGKIVHGDGHVTNCPCPPECKCKAPKGSLCESGTCVPKK